MARSLALLILPICLTSACAGSGGKKSGDDTAADTGGGGGGSGGGTTYDEGCITVDGEGGYAWINDAIAVADEGSTINLCASTDHEEEVVVDKAVSIVGPGSDNFLLIAPTNTTGLTVTASGASVTGIAVDSTRNGIAVEGAEGVSLSDVSVVSAGNWGIYSEDAIDLAVTSSTLLGNGYGGLGVDGGSVSASGLMLTANTSYGIYATNDAILTLSDSEISETAPANPDSPEDGYGAYADEGAALVLSGNVWTSNLFAAVRTDEADASLNGDTISGSAYGMILRLGAFDLTDTSIEGATVMGALLVSLDTLNVDGLSVVTESEFSGSYAYNEWGTADVGVPGTGVVAVADEMVLSNIDIANFNNCGLFLQPASSSTTGTATASNILIENTGRYGVYTSSMNASFTDSSVIGTRLVDTEEERTDPSVGADVLCYYVNYFAGIYNAEGSVSWSGGAIDSNAGWGVSSIFGNVDMDGTTIASNHCAGVIGYQGTTAIRNSTLTGHIDNNVINSNSDTLVVLEGNTFTANRSEDGFDVVYDYMDTSGYRITYSYAPGFAQVSDVLLFEVAESIVQNNVFETGDRGIQLYGGEGLISDNSWTGYRSTVLDIAEYDTPADVEMSGNTITNAGGVMIGCNDSSLDVSDLTVTTGGHYSYSYDYTLEFSDGSTSTSTSTGTSGNVGLRADACSLFVDTATFNTLEGNAVELSAYTDATTTAELNDVNILDVGTSSDNADSAVTVNNYGGDISIYADGIAVTNAANDHGIEVTATAGTTLVEATDVRVNGAMDNGVNATGSASATVTLNIDELDVQNTGSDGLHAEYATLTLSSSTLANNAGSGARLIEGDTTISDTSFNDNAAYGLECEGAGVQACATVLHSANALGEQLGCDATCGEEAEDEDTGTP